MARRKIIFPILVLCFAFLACSVPSGQVATNTPFPPIVDVPTLTPTVMVPTATLQNGTISGNVNYPSDFVPPQKVVAYRVGDFSTYYTAETALNETAYTISVPPGDYYVVSYVMDGNLAGGYTQAIPCGLQYGCDDHSLITVTVNAGQTTSDINPFDWYAPAGAFPPMP
jgi:hypothetical protein